MRRMLRILLAISAVVAAPTIGSAQSAPPTFSEQEAREIAEQAAATAKGDRSVFDKTFRDLARKKVSPYRDGGHVVPCCVGSKGKAVNAGLGVTVHSRLSFFQRAVWEQIRTLKPVADAAWPKHEVIVTLTSAEMTAPLIDRIVLKRNDLVIEPTESVIVEGDARNLQGAVFKAREGWVGFPLSAFAPEKKLKVSLMLIPVAASDNLIARIDDPALARINMTSRQWYE